MINEASIEVGKSQYVFFGQVFNAFLADLFKVSVGTIYAWIQDIAGSILESEVGGGIKEIEIDEMWHYISKKLKNWKVVIK